MMISIIIPVYNEEATIATVIEKVMAVELPLGCQKEIIVINDGSQDQTAKILNQYQNKMKIIHQNNLGKTAALLKGLEHAQGDIFLIQDADLEYDPIHYPKLLEPILSGQTEVVYGSRFLGKVENMYWVNRLANLASNLVFRWLWKQNITDITTCYKVFTSKALNGISVKGKGFIFETEITVRFLQKSLKILEIPISYKARSRAEGKKMNWLTALEMFWPIIKLRFK